MSKSVKEKNDEAGSFALNGMLLLSSIIHAPKHDFDMAQPFSIGFNIDARVSPARDTVFLYPHFFIKEEKTEETCAEFKLEFQFAVKGNIDVLLPLATDGSVGINDVFAATLNSIVYSTSRGVIYMALRGTHLQGAMLPIIDPAMLKSAPLSK